jgi:acylphosphatase
MGDMKLKIKITGDKVHDVGYRYFLMSMAMANRIRMFEAHNTESIEGEEVLVFADGNEDAIESFRALVKTNRPARSKVSNIIFDDFKGDIMKIGEYAQFCATVQLNKAIPVLLDMRDDLKAVRRNTDVIPQVKTNTDAIPQVKANTDAIIEEIKGLRDDIQPGNARQMQSDVRAIKERLGMS